ncbi:hypothetical protein [Microbacterium sp. JZ31]|uniref:hypothetical protein n=1 Tax=Microbacterium sp. JZ31 TaxID=1906274 RepID=UPI001931751E|nr:hypothetical protein [Microbacterium sp. JZ31]
MAEGYEIRSGGAIAVATHLLREAAARFDAVAGRMTAAANHAMSAWFGIAPPYRRDPAWDVSARASQASLAAQATAGDLRRAADVYDAADTEARLALLRTSDAAHTDIARDARLLERRLDGIEARSPGAREEARALLEEWDASWLSGFEWLLPLAPDAPPHAPAAMSDEYAFGEILGAAIGSVRAARAARSRGATPTPRSDPVEVWARPVASAPPPTSLRERAARIPYGAGAARVRIEKLTFGDGSRRFGVYITGTRDMRESDPEETFDMESNLRQHAGEEGTSSDVVEEALRQAGAKPGDVIDLTGHSQGVMAANVVALKGEYQVASVLALGHPAVVPHDPATLTMHVAFEDDLVGSLSGGGIPGVVGSPDSLDVRGDYGGDGEPGRWPDPGAHAFGGYLALLEEVEASGDARMAPFREHLAALAEAETVDVTEYSANRLPE